MGLNVKNSRCAAQTIAFFGSLYIAATSVYLGLRVVDLYNEKTKAYSKWPLSQYAQYAWYNGYPVLIGCWCDFTACMGVRATNKRAPKSICKIQMFVVFLLALIGFQAYYIYDFLPVVKQYKANIGGLWCATVNKSFWTNCYLRVTLLGCLVSLAVLVVILASWCVLCSFFSLCNASPVDPDSIDDTQVSSPDPAPKGQPLSEQPLPGTIPMATVSVVTETHPEPNPPPGSSGLYPDLPPDPSPAHYPMADIPSKPSETGHYNGTKDKA